MAVEQQHNLEGSTEATKRCDAEETTSVIAKHVDDTTNVEKTIDASAEIASSVNQQQSHKRSNADTKDTIGTSQTSAGGDSGNKSKPMSPEAPPQKKRRTEDTHAEQDGKSEQKSKVAEEHVGMDVCEVINLKPNMRIEVKWDLLTGVTEEVKATEEVKTETRWWGAKLLPHDGRMHTLTEGDGVGDDNVTIPLRVLDYDPYVAGGFPDRSLAEVTFLNDHLLYEVGTDTHLSFRIDGSTWEEEQDDEADDDTVLSATSNGGREEALRSMLESILLSALASSGVSAKMKTLGAAQQCFMADKIRLAKESLVEKMIKKVDEEAGGVITADCVRQCMQEMGSELRAL